MLDEVAGRPRDSSVEAGGGAAGDDSGCCGATLTAGAAVGEVDGAGGRAEPREIGGFSARGDAVTWPNPSTYGRPDRDGIGSAVTESSVARPATTQPAVPSSRTLVATAASTTGRRFDPVLSSASSRSLAASSSIVAGSRVVSSFSFSRCLTSGHLTVSVVPTAIG